MQTNFQSVSDLLNSNDREYPCGCKIHLIVPDQAVFKIESHQGATPEHIHEFVQAVTRSLHKEVLANHFMSRFNA